MEKLPEEGIHELYAKDPEKADYILWGRVANKPSRRGFLRNMGLSAMATVLGGPIVFAKNMPSGVIPALLAQNDDLFKLYSKDKGLIVLNDRPVNAETPPHLLNETITPADKFFSAAPLNPVGYFPLVSCADRECRFQARARLPHPVVLSGHLPGCRWPSRANAILR